MSVQPIDYDQLAAALLRALVAGFAGTGAHSVISQVGGVVQAKPAEALGPVTPPKSEGEEEAREAGAVSWADEVIEDVEVAASAKDTVSENGSLSSGSVTYSDGVPVAGEAVRQVVQFGGLVDDYGRAPVEASAGKSGYYATVVRGPGAKALKKQVEAASGVKVPKEAVEDLALCAFTAGAMPDVVERGKQRLRSLASVGDSAITTALTTQQWAAGRDVESAQAARSKLTNNKHMANVMMTTGLYAHVAYPPGVDPATSVASATAYEAIVGVLALYRGSGAVKQFLAATKLLVE